MASKGVPVDKYYELTSYLNQNNRRWLTNVTAHIYFEDLHTLANILNVEAPPAGTFFIRRAFCILTSRIPPSP